MQGRYDDLLEDVHDLYPIRPRSVPGKGSWPGHVKEYERLRGELHQLHRNYTDTGCRDDDQSTSLYEQCYEWEAKKAPNAPKKSWEYAPNEGGSGHSFTPFPAYPGNFGGAPVPI